MLSCNASRRFKLLTGVIATVFLWIRLQLHTSKMVPDWSTNSTKGYANQNSIFNWTYFTNVL